MPRRALSIPHLMVLIVVLAEPEVIILADLEAEALVVQQSPMAILLLDNCLNWLGTEVQQDQVLAHLEVKALDLGHSAMGVKVLPRPVGLEAQE